MLYNVIYISLSLSLPLSLISTYDSVSLHPSAGHLQTTTWTRSTSCRPAMMMLWTARGEMVSLTISKRFLRLRRPRTRSWISRLKLPRRRGQAQSRLTWSRFPALMIQRDIRTINSAFLAQAQQLGPYVSYSHITKNDEARPMTKHCKLANQSDFTLIKWTLYIWILDPEIP